jgi:hypothetical protein
MSLTLTLACSLAECIRGESVPFDVVLTNGNTMPFKRAPTFHPDNESLAIIAVPRDADAGPQDPGKALQIGEMPPRAFAGTARSAQERGGIHRHGIDEPDEMTLQPGQTMNGHGDLLEWLGELPPGNYAVYARYRGPAAYVVSAAVMLHVLPAAPVIAAVASRGRCTEETSLAAGWVHTESAKQQLLFYQLQSSALPSSPKRGIRAATARQTTQLAVASISSILCPFGHLVWIDQGKLRVGAVDIGATKSAATVDPRRPPWSAGSTLLRSPLSRQDGSVLIPIASEKGDELSIFHVPMAGDAKNYPIDLGKVSPIGTYSCLWDMERALNFLWTSPKGREIQLASMLLEAPIGPAPVRQLFVAAEPVTWLEGYLDISSALADTAAFEHNATDDDRKMTGPPLPKINVWLLYSRRKELVCARFMSANNREKTEMLLDTGGKDFRVVGSTINKDFAWCLLLADQSNTLHYASTVTEKITPLADLTGQSIGLDQYPALMAANSGGVLAWVYLRYIDRKQNAVRFIKIEPAREKEPAPPHVH